MSDGQTDGFSKQHSMLTRGRNTSAEHYTSESQLASFYKVLLMIHSRRAISIAVDVSLLSVGAETS